MTHHHHHHHHLTKNKNDSLFNKIEIYDKRVEKLLTVQNVSFKILSNFSPGDLVERNILAWINTSTSETVLFDKVIFVES